MVHLRIAESEDTNWVPRCLWEVSIKSEWTNPRERDYSDDLGGDGRVGSESSLQRLAGG
jgi:hypothetical protein